jgi:hypothetical protein
MIMALNANAVKSISIPAAHPALDPLLLAS